MKNFSKTLFHRWRLLLAVICIAGTGVGIYRFFHNNLEAHILMCAYFPKLADYRAFIDDDDKSMALVLQRDEFAYTKFTEFFSEPIQVSIHDNGAILSLKRVWKTSDGYLILATGRDPRDFEMYIYHSEEKPILNKPFEILSDLTTVTKAFLEDYKVAFIPISGPRGPLEIQHDRSSYTINGQAVEQDGSGKPANIPEADFEDCDKPHTSKK
jgi:hypothetical protein